MLPRKPRVERPSTRMSPVHGTRFKSALPVVDLPQPDSPTRDSANLRMPRFTTPGPVTRHLDAEGYEVTTGIGSDLMEGSRAAVSGMIDLLCATRGMKPEDAYMLCSVCGDLRISEIVDQPNWVVSFYFPRIVFA